MRFFTSSPRSQRPDKPFFFHFPSALSNFSDFRESDGLKNAENNVRSKVQQPPTTSEVMPESEQLMEGGVSTSTDRVIRRSARNASATTTQCDQTNKFKPANEEHGTANMPNDDKVNTKPESSDQEDSSEANRRASLQKSRSFGGNENPYPLRDRVSKNSTKVTGQTASAPKSVEEGNKAGTDEEMLINNGMRSRSSLTACTGEDTTNKRKNEVKSTQKSSRNLAHSKSKEEKSGPESSEKSEVSGRENQRTRKANSEKERI